MSSKNIIVGAPFSTFTRTLRMAFYHLKIEYELQETLPHTELAYKYNPFGRIPSFLHNDRVIFESAAIRDYIDTIFNSKLTPEDLDTRLKVDQMISILCDYVFHHIVFGVAKPRAHYEQEGIEEHKIKEKLKKAVDMSIKILKGIEGLLVEGDVFLCGNDVTWADYFFYPPMADIYSLPEAQYFQEQAPKLYTWFQNFGTREESTLTYPNTVAYTRSKNKSTL